MSSEFMNNTEAFTAVTWVSMDRVHSSSSLAPGGGLSWMVSSMGVRVQWVALDVAKR